jgi:hypothetical protein
MSAFAHWRQRRPLSVSYATVMPQMPGEKLHDFLTLLYRQHSLPLAESYSAQKFGTLHAIQGSMFQFQGFLRITLNDEEPRRKRRGIRKQRREFIPKASSPNV